MRALRISLFTLACLITLIALWHAEENWRGARAWKNYHQEQMADGKYVDPLVLIPPRVPDAENFAMTPFLAPLYDYQPGTQTHRDKAGLERAQTFGNGVPNFPRKHGSNFEVDLVALANDLRHPSQAPRVDPIKVKAMPYSAPPFYGTVIQGGDVSDRKEAAQVVLNGFNMYAPVIEELRAASRRPYVRFNIAYDNPDKIAILLPHLGVLRNVCRIVTVRAQAELISGQTDKAADDAVLALYLAEAPKSEAMVVSQLVRCAALHEAMQPIIVGLREHLWSDADIKRFQDVLDKIDVIGAIKTSIDAEEIFFADTCFEQLKAARNPLTLLRNWNVMIGPNQGPYGDNPLADAFFYVAVPSGWFDFERVNYHRLEKATTGPCIDVSQHCVYPEKAEQADKMLQRLKGLGPVHNIFHHEIVALVGVPALAKLGKKTAGAAAEVDLTRLACALERARMANGQYPDDLNSLSPKFISSVPNDPIQNGPLHYRRDQDGFTLYSVGWNGTDDGGKIVPMTDKNSRPDPNQGDWVWGNSVNP